MREDVARCQVSRLRRLPPIAHAPSSSVSYRHEGDVAPLPIETSETRRSFESSASVEKGSLGEPLSRFYETFESLTVFLHRLRWLVKQDGRLGGASDASVQDLRVSSFARASGTVKGNAYLSFRACSSRPLTASRTRNSSAMFSLTAGEFQAASCRAHGKCQRQRRRSQFAAPAKRPTGSGQTRSKTEGADWSFFGSFA